MSKKETKRISIRVDIDTYKKLCKLSQEEKNSISNIARNYIEVGVGIRSTTEDIDRISEIIKHQVEMVCEQPLERLIKIVIKNIRSSESSKYILCSLLKEFSQNNTDEIIEKAEQQAIIYATNRK